MSIARIVRSHVSLKAVRHGLAALAVASAAPGVASADPMVFIDQAGGVGKNIHGFSDPHFGQISDPVAHGAWKGLSGPPPSMFPPELIPAAKHPNAAGNIAVGNFNTTAQLQKGRHDRSLVGILGGNHDTVNVVQLGNNLQSNIVLLNPPPGLNLTFVQRPNSPPLDLLIAHLHNGQWLVKK